MSATCETHQFEVATDTCRACGYDFCQECLVYPMGVNRPPFCVPCALSVAGVRSTAARHPRADRPTPKLSHAGGSMLPRVAAGVVVLGAGLAAAVTLL